MRSLEKISVIDSEVIVRDAGLYGSMDDRLHLFLQARRKRYVDYGPKTPRVIFKPSDAENAAVAVIDPAVLATDEALEATFVNRRAGVSVPAVIAALAAVSFDAEISRHPGFRANERAIEIYREHARTIAGVIIPVMTEPLHAELRGHLNALLIPPAS